MLLLVLQTGTWVGGTGECYCGSHRCREYWIAHVLTPGPSGKADTQIEVPAGLEPLLRLDGVACFRTCTLAKEYMVPYRFCA